MSSLPLGRSREREPGNAPRRVQGIGAFSKATAELSFTQTTNTHIHTHKCIFCRAKRTYLTLDIACDSRVTSLTARNKIKKRTVSVSSHIYT